MTNAHTTGRLITGEELFEMGDIGPCELVEGRIVPMSPAGMLHAVMVPRLASHLSNFVEPRKLGRVLCGEVGVYTRRAPDTVRGADVAFVSRSRMSSVKPSYLEVAPELIVEILSPKDPWPNVRRKLDEYFAIGVERVWVVDPRKRTVRVYRSPTEVMTLVEGGTLRGEGVLEGFELPVASLFAE